MLDTRNRATPYPHPAEQCRRLATSTPPSSQMKNRYLLVARDYMWLADLKSKPYAQRALAVEHATWAPAMTGRFPASCHGWL